MTENATNVLEEMKEGIADLRVSVGKLETVVRMNIAEQRRFNRFACRDMEAVKHDQLDLGDRLNREAEELRTVLRQSETLAQTGLRRLDIRFSFFAGGLSVLVFLFNVAVAYLSR